MKIGNDLEWYTVRPIYKAAVIVKSIDVNQI